MVIALITRCGLCGGRKLDDEPCPECGERTCRVCGCTEDEACPEGCSWYDDGLCSRCVGAELAKKGAG